MTKSQDIPGLIARLRDRRFPGKWSDTVIPDALCIEAADALEALSAAPKSEGAVTGEPVAWRWRWASDGHWKPLGMNVSSEAARADFIRDQEKIAPIVVEALGVLAPSNPIPAAREEVGVKPLEWIGSQAETLLGTYWARIWNTTTGEWTFKRPGTDNWTVAADIDGKWHKSLTEKTAKSAAQAHFDAAIRSALRQAPAAPSQEAVWPDFVAPSKYDNPAPGWTDPELPDFRKIWEAARRCGYAVGLHGSMKRDCDLIATPWAENALAPESLIDELCKALNAREVGIREAKPSCRVAVNLQVDGWVKLIDLSIVGVPQAPLVTAVPTLTWPDGTVYQFSIEQGRRAIAAALASPQGQEGGVTKP